MINLTFKSIENIKRIAFHKYRLLLTDKQAMDIMDYHFMHKKVPFDKLIEKFLDKAVGK